MPHVPSIVDVGGLEVGHVTDALSGTGCTVFLLGGARGAPVGMDIRGSAAGTRGVEPARAFHVVDRHPAVLFAGGSSFGLAATGGVMRWCEERKRGFDVGVTHVPVIPTAILFDLSFGRSDRRPDEAMGYAACEAASADPPAEGSVGAGTGATVGKILGPESAMKGGFGTTCLVAGSGARVGAAVAVNALGDVRRWPGGEILAGARAPGGAGFLDTFARIVEGLGAPRFVPANTTLALVATSARFGREELIKISQTAHDGLARAITPCHTTVDGDVVFATSTGDDDLALDAACVMAQQAVADAVVRAILAADGLGILPAARDLARPGA